MTNSLSYNLSPFQGPFYIMTILQNLNSLFLIYFLDDKPVDYTPKEDAGFVCNHFKHKRPRTMFTLTQLQRMEREFVRRQYITGSQRLKLAEELQLSETQVRVWFQNRRIKWRKEMIKRQFFHGY